MNRNNLLKATGILDGETHQTEIDVQAIPLFPVIIKHPFSFDGEYGFDWMRLGSETYDSEDYRIESENFALLENEYSIEEIEKDVKYYVPWLLMFPNHKSVVGKDVELLLIADILKVDSAIDYDDKINISCISNSIEISPNEITVDDLFNGGASIVVKCISPLRENTSVNIEIESNVFNTPQLVGKLNILKNDNYKDFKINVDVIYSYLTDDRNFGLSSIESDINSMGGLNELENYLNKNSLNQALIQVKLNYENNNKHNWAFRKSTLELINQGISPQTEAQDYYYHEYKRLIYDHATMEVNNEIYTRYINDRYNLMGHNNQNRIRLYMTSLKAKDSGGMAYVTPLNNVHCIVFKSNLTKKSTHAHELAHTLGLYHTFKERDSNGTEQDIEYWISNVVTSLENKISDIENQKQTYISNNRAYFDRNPNELKNDEYLKNFDKKNKYWSQIKEDYPISMIRNNLKFKRGRTTNIMDYSLKRTYFSKKQWEIMQHETKEYYNGK